MKQQRNFKTLNVQKTPRHKLWIRIVSSFVIFCFIAQDAAFSIGIPQYSVTVVASNHLNLLSLFTQKVYAGGSATNNIQTGPDGQALSIQRFDNNVDLPAPVKTDSGGAKTATVGTPAAGTGMLDLATRAGNNVMGYATGIASPYLATGKSAYNLATNPATWNSAAGAVATGLNKFNNYLSSTPLQAQGTPGTGFTQNIPLTTTNSNAVSPSANNPATATAAAPSKYQPNNYTFNYPSAPSNSYLPSRTATMQPYKLPAINVNSTLKPITPVFITPQKITALNSGLPNTYTALKPIKPDFIKLTSTTPKLTALAPIKPQLISFNKLQSLNSSFDTKLKPLFNKDLKPVFLPIKNPITTPIFQPVLIKPQWVKLDSSFNQMTKPVLPKLEAISALKQPTPLKPVFTYIKPITPIMLPLDSKLTRAPAPIFTAIPKLNTSFTSLKPSFISIKQPEPIKITLNKINPYLIKEQPLLFQIKPNFAPIAQDLTMIRPQIAKMAQLNQPIKPEFTKISQISPKFIQPVPIKPNLISMSQIKPINVSFKNLTQVPQTIATPKFIPADFSAVKKPVLITMKQSEPINVMLGQLNPALNKDLKPVFSPVKNPTTIFITRPTPIKPQWVITSPLNQPIKPEFTKIAQTAPTFTQPVPIKPEFTAIEQAKPALVVQPLPIKPAQIELATGFNKMPELAVRQTISEPIKVENTALDLPKVIKPDFKTISTPQQTPLVMPVIEKPEVIAIKELPMPRAGLNNIPLTFEKIKPQETVLLEFQKLIVSSPITISPVAQKPTPLLTQVAMPQGLAQALENPINKSANLVMVGNKVLEALKPNLVDNYIQQLKTVYEWQKMNRELAYLSRNAEVIIENGASVELSSLNEKITRTKTELDRRSPEVKNILATNLVEPAIFKNSENNIQLGNFPVKEVPMNNELPQSLPFDRNLPLNPPALLPETLPKLEGGFLPGLRTMLRGNVFAVTNDLYAGLIDYDLERAARLRNQTDFRTDPAYVIK